MLLKRLLTLALLLTACFAVEAAVKKAAVKKPICDNKASCLNNPNCQCFCAREGDYRDKKLDENDPDKDSPIYLSPEEDEHGFSCYCKQWDYDNAAPYAKS